METQVINIEQFTINGETVNEYMLFNRAAEYFAKEVGIENFHPLRTFEFENEVVYLLRSTYTIICVEKGVNNMIPKVILQKGKYFHTDSIPYSKL